MAIIVTYSVVLFTCYDINHIILSSIGTGALEDCELPSRWIKTNITCLALIGGCLESLIGITTTPPSGW